MVARAPGPYCTRAVKPAGNWPLWETASRSCHELRPVKMVARQGLHFGFDVKAFLKSTPSRATRSKLGVFTHVHP